MYKFHVVYSQGKKHLISVVVFLALLSRQHTANAQHLLTTFGTVTELKTLKNAYTLVSADFNGDGNSDLATCSGKKIQIQLYTSDSTSWKSYSWYADTSIGQMFAGRLNNDSYSDLVLISESRQEIITYLAKANEKFYLAWKYALPENADKLLLADINNDKRTDILLFGKKQSGITVMFGKGNGTFRTGTVLFPELSFSLVDVNDVNGDGISDVLALNWVMNELLFYSGIGIMKYGDPSVISFTNEPGYLVVTDLNSDHLSDLAVAFTDERQYQTYVGDGFGGYRLEQTIDIGSFASNVFARDFNGDGKNDLGIVCPLDAKIYVSLNNGAGKFDDHTDFDAGESASASALLTSSFSQLAGIAVLDSSRTRIRIFHSARRTIRSNEPIYSVGLHPSDILCRDINNDGWNDLMTANSGSQNMSLLLNKLDGNFDGQIAFDLPIKPQALQAYPMHDSSVVIVGTAAEDEKISVSTIHLTNFSQISYSLPTIGVTEILHVSTTAERKLRVFVLEREQNANKASLTEYAQLDSVRFIQKEIAVPGKIQMIAAAMSDLNHDGYQDIVYVILNNKKKQLEYYSSLGNAETVFNSPSPAFTGAALSLSAPVLWLYDVNGDGMKDILMFENEPEPSFMIANARAYQAFDAPVTIAKRNIRIDSKRDLVCTDLNEDKNPDLVIRNSASKTIESYYGRGDGTFVRKSVIMSSEGIGGFTFADTDRDGFQELILTEQANGVVKIISLKGR